MPKHFNFYKLFSPIAIIALMSASVLSATFTVTKTEDTNDGLCDADCSLREAIASANSVSGDDVIDFSPSIFNTAQTVTLGGTEFFVAVNGSITINGPGSSLLTVSGNDSSPVFGMADGASLSISGLRITLGNAVSNFDMGGCISVGNNSHFSLDNSIITNCRARIGGGALSSFGTVNINNSVISANTAFDHGGALRLVGTTTITNTVVTGNSTTNSESGAGIYTLGGLTTTSIENSSITNNISGGDGGGISNRNNGTLIVNNCTITGNKSFGNTPASVGNGGGGIYNESGSSASISNSIFSGNSIGSKSLSIQGGGGIHNRGTMTMVNSTISSNDSNASRGGGISNFGSLSITNVTVVNNTTASTLDSLGGGGGIFNSGLINIHNSLVADNNDIVGNSPDIRGPVTSMGYNLVENISGATITGTTTGNILGQDPQLVPLRNNGGTTTTVSLQPTSPAIDAGDPVNSPATDQRGIQRPQDGDLNGSAIPDIGAYERQVTPFAVSKTSDTNDGFCDADCSLREAVAAMNTSPMPDRAIVFDPTVFASSSTIALNLGQLLINGNGTAWIHGTGNNLLTINGNNQSRIFSITSTPTVSIDNLRIINGKEQFNNGGAILNLQGSLTLSNLVINTCQASNGGALFNSGGQLTLRNSTLDGNIAGTSGGAISNSTVSQFKASLYIINSIIQNNSAASSGGGVADTFGNAFITGTTINANIVTGSSNSGGGIYSVNGDIRISGSTLTNNSATDSGGGILITASDGKLLVDSTMISNNHAINGGGVRNTGSTTTITNSTLRDNTANFRGGAILVDGGTVIVSGSAVTNNSAVNNGGGLANFGTLTVTNSTVAVNSSGGAGGGIYNLVNGTFVNTTISGNTAAASSGVANDGSLTSRNSIFADNTPTNTNSAYDFGGTMTSEGYNIVKNTMGLTVTGTTNGNLLGQDPLLGPLANNGGPSQTQSLLPGSPAIDAGDPANSITMDQRGVSRPRDGDGNGIARGDIGAFELRAILVTNVNDAGSGSLRQAIADASIQSDAVVFNAGLFNSTQTILLSSELFIPSGANFTINGRGSSRLTIDANRRSRVMYVSAGATVTLSGATITGGTGSGADNNGHDGGISNWGSLTVLDSVVRDNTANGNGGGIGSYLNAILTVKNSTIRNNSTATIAGGGLFIDNSSATIMGSTINNNNAAGVGGGMASIFGNVTVLNCTISNNTAGNGGGGISNFTASSMLTLTNATISGNATINNSGGGINNNTGGSVSIRNTIIANNIGQSPDLSGPITSQGYNLIKNTAGATITGVTLGNILGQDPLLLPLGNYGGSTQTQLLRNGSPAIDKGSAVLGLTGDQRGQVRPVDFVFIANAAGGNGSDIGSVERQLSDFTPQSTSFDFDGDGRTDIGIFRPSAGEWWYSRSSDAVVRAGQFGSATDIITPGDFTGDGKADIAFYRPSTGFWFILRSEDGSFFSFPFGTNGDIPMPADFDGDGKTDAAVFRPSTGTWYILQSSGAGTGILQFGANGDKPVSFDYDGDGKADIGIVRDNLQTGNKEWWILRSTQGILILNFGIPGDLTVPGDYTGDGKADVGFFRPSTGFWYILRSEDHSFFSFPFGTNGDIPTPGDYDGDGKSDAAVFRPSTSTWFVNRSGGSGVLIAGFGLPTDQPIPSCLVR